MQISQVYSVQYCSHLLSLEKSLGQCDDLNKHGILKPHMSLVHTEVEKGIGCPGTAPITALKEHLSICFGNRKFSPLFNYERLNKFPYLSVSYRAQASSTSNGDRQHFMPLMEKMRHANTNRKHFLNPMLSLYPVFWKMMRIKGI